MNMKLKSSIAMSSSIYVDIYFGNTNLPGHILLIDY